MMKTLQRLFSKVLCALLLLLTRRGQSTEALGNLTQVAPPDPGHLTTVHPPFFPRSQYHDCYRDDKLSSVLPRCSAAHLRSSLRAGRYQPLCLHYLEPYSQSSTYFLNRTKERVGLSRCPSGLLCEPCRGVNFVIYFSLRKL